MPSYSRGAKWGTLISCSLSYFLAWLDFAIVNTALPAIQSDLSASLLQLQWVMNGFVLALTVTVVTVGRMADLWGRRLVNILGVGLFGLSSLGAGLSESPDGLIAFRFLQGVASSAIVTSSLALISHAFPTHEKGKAIGTWGGIAAIGTALGPVLGGIFVSALSWRWIFYINVPIAAISMIVSLLFIQESRHEGVPQRIDWKGVFLMTIGLTFFAIALMSGPDWGWMSAKTATFLAIAVISLFWFYRSELKSPYPTIPFTLFAGPGFLYSTLVGVCFSFVFTAAIFLMPLYLMNIHHEKPYIAGLMLLPITGCIALFSPFIGHLVDKGFSKILMIIGLCFYIGSTIMQSRFLPETSAPFILGAFTLMGLGMAFGRNTATTRAIASAPRHLAGTAGGVLWTVQNAACVLSLAVIVTMFRTIFETSSTPASFVIGYHYAMWLASAVILATILTLLFAFKK